ncbi:lumazine binding protein [Winogradskyella wandonensis]|uniref:Lumazine binding protein n=1 Tax=Winogradskyella wandonensis TaxID=1442586 RepID=A0A4R1KJU3_9FLAO|nr:hypothetical protein [Winogradskyella wandonensis]TCK65056.1 lumazine binding protein [Winogradskyella wandonensis]
MKTIKSIFKTLIITAITFTSCESSDDRDNDCDGVVCNPASAAEFQNLKENAREALKQDFQLTVEDGITTLTTANGVSVSINGACLTVNGSPATGIIDVELIEIFDKANMLKTNRTTLGTLPGGDKAMLLTGGEFLIEAFQNGNEVVTNCPLELQIPSNLTGGTDPAMELWTGRVDENDNITWDEMEGGPQGMGGEVFSEGGQYYAFFNDFGWSNVDRFYNDPRPKTTILVAPPAGYDNTNSAVYISYDGEDTGLANMDVYDPVDGLFSEHYGQIPIGLECHVIFAAPNDTGGWVYHIQSVTIAANDQIMFNAGDLISATDAELTSAINALP